MAANPRAGKLEKCVRAKQLIFHSLWFNSVTVCMPASFWVMDSEFSLTFQKRCRAGIWRS